MENPIVIIFVASMCLIACHMLIQGVVAAYDVSHRVIRRLSGTRDSSVPLAKEQGHSVIAHPVIAVKDTGNVLDVMARACHILCIGGTGGGKSVIVRAFVNRLCQQGKISILALDPDAAPRHYPSPVQLINDDELWVLAIKSVADEFRQRNEAYRSGTEDFPPLWIVADECQELLAIDGVLETIERVIRRGRKLNMHICLAVQDSQVRTLGLERKSALLVNLSRIEVRSRNGARVAAIDGKEYSIPCLPTTYDGATGTVFDIAAAPTSSTANEVLQWTVKHHRCAEILEESPDISGRKLALALYGHETGESYTLAKKIRSEVTSA